MGDPVWSRRAYRGAADLRAMQGLTQRVWSLSNYSHIGDLAWQRFEHCGRESEWATALWEVDGQVVAWGWRQSPGHLMLQADPRWPGVLDEVLDWFADVAPSAELTVTDLDASVHVLAALERAGFQRRDEGWEQRHLRHSLEQLPEPVLPEGFVARAVRGPVDLEQRVAVHQAAWHPSRVTMESYRNVMSAWPYRPDLDWVVQAPDGRFVANCLIWLDWHNGVGELEPVGTHPEFRRLGLARAVCLAAMHALRAAGARQAVVYPVEGHPQHPGPLPLYLGVGFQPYARTVTYVRHRSLQHQDPAGAV